MKPSLIMTIKFVFCLSLVWAIGVSCTTFKAPVRELPTETKIKLNIIQAPEEVERGGIGEFVIETEPGADCFASIGYRDLDKVWQQQDLDQVLADSSGICKWVWEIPITTNPGEAEFRVGVQVVGEVRMLIPLLFKIQPELSDFGDSG